MNAADAIGKLKSNHSAVQAKAEMQQSHAHFWLIATPSGPTSKGVCRGCGATREFRNWFDEDFHQTDRLAIRPPKDYQPPVEHTNAVRR